jgi:lysozyme family protein
MYCSSEFSVTPLRPTTRLLKSNTIKAIQQGGLFIGGDGMDFNSSFKAVIGFEGGYSDQPDDRGGKTKYGVTEGTLRSAQNKGWVAKDVTIQTLTVDHAKTIYRKGYWDSIQGDRLPPPLDFIMFDSAINHGVGGAVTLLQEALNAILPGEPLAIDGSFGPRTQGALSRVLALDREMTIRYPQLESNFLFRYLCVDFLMNRTERFSWIAQNDSTQRAFLRGWIHQRVIILAEKAGMEG